MTKISTFITRGKKIESIHRIKCLITNDENKILLSSNNDNDIIFPRSSIKIFQAIPFISSGAVSKYYLNSTRPKQSPTPMIRPTISVQFVIT